MFARSAWAFIEGPFKPMMPFEAQRDQKQAEKRISKVSDTFDAPYKPYKVNRHPNNTSQYILLPMFLVIGKKTVLTVFIYSKHK